MAPPTMATFSRPEASSVWRPSPYTASVKMMANMMEFIRPTASRLHMATSPVVVAEIITSTTEPMPLMASSLPGLIFLSK